MQQHSKYFPESISSEGEGQYQTPPVYAEVVVPVHVSSSFIYRLRPEMRAVAQLGARLVVPLGRKRVTGFIVELHADLTAAPNLAESEVKEADELLDLVPLVTPELLELTKWVADYYLSPWGEVIKAALPPGITPAIDDYLAITEKGEAELNRLDSDSPVLDACPFIEAFPSGKRRVKDRHLIIEVHLQAAGKHRRQCDLRHQHHC